jgi:hypothetical protein
MQQVLNICSLNEKAGVVTVKEEMPAVSQVADMGQSDCKAESKVAFPSLVAPLGQERGCGTGRGSPTH